MALLKTFPTDYSENIQAVYWKIVESNINWLDSIAHVVIAGYVSEADRMAGMRFIATRSYDWSGDDFPFPPDNLPQLTLAQAFGMIYAKIKLTDEFLDAEDV